jgi:hypothetical protein
MTPKTPTPYVSFNISCPAGNYDCIRACAKYNIYGACLNPCTYLEYKDGKHVFKCQGMPAGNYTAGCESGDGSDNCCYGKKTRTYEISCDLPVCQFSRSENQANCPSDCKTEVKVYADFNKDGKLDELVTPSSSLYPNQMVRVVVSFNDSRYNSTQGFNLRLDANIESIGATIERIEWKEDNGCSVCGKSLDSFGCDASKRGHKKSCDGSSKGYPMKVYMEEGYARVEFNATLPRGLTGGPHSIKITPVVLSHPVVLKPAVVEFRVGNGLYSFVLIVKNVFSRLTGFFGFVKNF